MSDRFIDSGASDAHLKRHLALGGVHCLIQDGRITGLSILDGSTIDLTMVDPRQRRRGLGSLLLRHAETTLLARYATIRLESFAGNAAANSFYQACGWSLRDRLEGEGPAKIEYRKSRTAS